MAPENNRKKRETAPALLLPDIIDITDFLKGDYAKPEPIIEGLLDKGSKMILSGGSKTRKTWILTHLAMCIASGSPWWGFNTGRGRVLYINLEIGKAYFQKRVSDTKLKLLMEGNRVMEGNQLKGWLQLWNLRGHAADISDLVNEIIDRVKMKYDVVIIDPIYKVLGDRDENSNSDVANDVLLREIAPLLIRPVGRPSNAPHVRYMDFQYQAQSWGRARRVVAKVEWHRGELFPRIGFIVSNLNRRSKAVVRFYNQRGTAEQWIKEGKNAVRWTRLSCHDFVDNQVRLILFVLAYNMGNFLRQAVLPRSVRHWSLTTLREKLIKVGAKVVCHSRQVIFQMAEVAVPRELFRAILEKIESLRMPATASG